MRASSDKVCDNSSTNESDLVIHYVIDKNRGNRRSFIMLLLLLTTLEIKLSLRNNTISCN